jgi:hypothetical protein
VTALGALGSRLGERLTTHAATVGVVGLDARLVVDTRNATGALGEFPRVVRL